jgi:hypothetical protein
MPEYGSPFPKSVSVRGYEIKRVSLGRMLAALERIKDAPKEFFEQTLKNGANAADPIGVALQVAPGYVIALIGELTGIGREKLETDPEVGLDGLLEIADAWLDINGVINFIRAARIVWMAWKGRAAKDGCIELSPERFGSGSESGSCLRTTTLTRLAEYLGNTRNSSNPARKESIETSGAAP